MTNFNWGEHNILSSAKGGREKLQKLPLRVGEFELRSDFSWGEHQLGGISLYFFMKPWLA